MLNSSAMALAGDNMAASKALADTTEQIFEKLRITGFPCEQQEWVPKWHIAMTRNADLCSAGQLFVREM
ncbi:hypothetical protein LOY52_03950 [Pseudomonas sp. B21-051]|uniref:hypothetical protein n=1 Tax=Pseudomonas sp. B21-051 TaxID=2895491 RepID=UPI00215ECBA0|nr:hypothetical protein [Pseudomonas sp. B21-051]UVK91212.1 hypothetical protein LOY52_03950 [Pseudomonas sp. B21-051]